MSRDIKTKDFDKMMDKRELREASARLWNANVISKETHWDNLRIIESGEISYK